MKKCEVERNVRADATLALSVKNLATDYLFSSLWTSYLWTHILAQSLHGRLAAMAAPRKLSASFKV